MVQGMTVRRRRSVGECSEFQAATNTAQGGGLRREDRKSIESITHTHNVNTKQLEYLKISKISSPEPCSRVNVVKHINFKNSSNYNLCNPSLWAREHQSGRIGGHGMVKRARAFGKKSKEMESVEMVTNVTYKPGVES